VISDGAVINKQSIIAAKALVTTGNADSARLARARHVRQCRPQTFPEERAGPKRRAQKYVDNGADRPKPGIQNQSSSLTTIKLFAAKTANAN
jgi:carbonic anhydrase/acetyltransferase-like protein (isoleucine patch superfamily)